MEPCRDRTCPRISGWKLFSARDHGKSSSSSASSWSSAKCLSLLRHEKILHDTMKEPTAVRHVLVPRPVQLLGTAGIAITAWGIRVDSPQVEAPSIAFVNHILARIKIASGEENLTVTRVTELERSREGEGETASCHPRAIAAFSTCRRSKLVRSLPRGLEAQPGLPGLLEREITEIRSATGKEQK